MTGVQTCALPICDGDVNYRPLGTELAGLSIAGPKARDVLASVVGPTSPSSGGTGSDVSANAFAFRDIQRMDLGMVPAIVGRITFTGDLGYECWVPASLQQRLFDLLMEAGEPHGIRLFGLRALDSMRFDKGFGGWASEFRPIYTPAESGLDAFVALTSLEIGRASCRERV